MKNLFAIIFIAISITSLLSACQNNLDQSTKTILDNVAKLKKKLEEIPAELKQTHGNLSSDQTVLFLLMQKVQEKSDFISTIGKRKSSYNQLELTLHWFKQEKNIDNWIDYLAIHNQMINAIKNDLNTLKDNPNLHEFCKNFAEKIIAVFTDAIFTYYKDKTISKNDLFSLIYAYQDYLKLFENYVKVDNEKITSMLKDKK